MFPKTGKKFPAERGFASSTYATLIADVLKSELAGSHQAHKTLTRDVSITFKTSSKELISNPKNQLICPVDSPRAHVLTEHLGIGEWLVRLVEAKDTAMGSLAKLDSPTYSSQIFVKFGGNGSFTYTFPFGAAFGALSGSYDMDETLLITLSPDTTSSGTLVVQTLPVGGNFKDGPDRVTVISRVNAQEKLDTTTNQQSIINAIRNLPR
ncbi:hypothetical protein ABIF63_010251 [Bradyrhizobium japonicum]|uniref:Uncharacterized protein n=1 Tax=Bradyrhizobium japonicum TaxID=375 RepID=A0ABV2SC82_BRAJP|nr:hypothetical protein [Bradyrhizobium japonicum]UQD99947.1 hypothetical protein JEY30_06645 [Bradyrhizobium japonicum]WLB19965.1 hypothetical protein QIH95_03035 [Bradyrhizobium japonicum]